MCEDSLTRQQEKVLKEFKWDRWPSSIDLSLTTLEDFVDGVGDGLVGWSIFARADRSSCRNTIIYIAYQAATGAPMQHSTCEQ